MMIARAILAFSLLCSPNVLCAQDRSVSVMLDWMAAPSIRSQIDVTSAQEKELIALMNGVRIEFQEFLGKTPLPWAKDGPMAEIAKEVLPTFKKHRKEVLARAEDQILSNILDPDQADQVLGLLISKSGPRSILESTVLQRRMGLSQEQIRDLEDVYFAPQDRWKEAMHEGDKFQHLDGAQQLSEFGYKYAKLREEIIDERIWKIADQIERAQVVMEEQAMRLLKPEQKLVYDDLLTKKPKVSSKK